MEETQTMSDAPDRGGASLATLARAAVVPWRGGEQIKACVPE